MISKIAKGIVPSLSTLVAFKANGYFQSLNMPRHEAIIVAAILAAVVALFLEEVINSAKKHSLIVRKILDKRARFEGDWFVETEPGSRMPFGVVSIDYNAETDCFSYSGAAYTQDGKLASEWSCEALQFDIPHSRIRFVCRTSMKGDNGAQHESYGWMAFKRSHLRRRLRYMRGDGFFTVIGKPELKGEFSMERLDPKFVKNVLGKHDIDSKDDMARVVDAYNNKKKNSAGQAR